jgi:Quinohemoprotein amine dehydrogenase, gamma subunit
MKHMRALNKKARRIESNVAEQMTAAAPTAAADDKIACPTEGDVVALQNPPAPVRPHVPMGCSLAFSPGWEVDSAGGTAGLCQPVERDIYDCYVTCFWPAQVPDHVNNYPDWASKCAVATKDWRNLDLVFP